MAACYSEEGERGRVPYTSLSYAVEREEEISQTLVTARRDVKPKAGPPQSQIMRGEQAPGGYRLDNQIVASA